MDELQSLRQELADLRREVRTLKRTRWIAPGSVAVALVALAVLGVASPRIQEGQDQTSHHPTQLAQDLVCKSIRVVDDAGHDMIQLGKDKDGGLLVVNGADGKKRFFTAVENNAGFSDWYDADGKRRATVFVGEKGAEFHLADKMEHISAVLQQTDEGDRAGGFLSLAGPDQNNRVAAGVDHGGGYLDLSDSLGNLRESFYLSDKNTAQFKLLGADKVLRFLISGDADTGRVTAYNQDGKPTGLFPVK
ncbi:MAG TPA: hypothetical protein VHE55_15900 [Fimbriimonadaceae bacterium]|nr:hypothetical protein [Fimbriimonadaceae bacterium]